MADFNIFGAKPSSNLEELYKMGLLGNQNDGSNFQDFTRKANRQSNVQGLLTGVLSYLAQPKNQNFGSALPYLARAGLQGVQAAGSSMNRYEQDAIKALQLKEQSRVLGQRNMTNETFAKLAEANPDLKQYLNMNVDFKNKIIQEMYTKSQAQPTYKAYKSDEDVYKEMPDGTEVLVRKGIPDDDGIKISNDRDAIANTYKGQTNSDTGVTYGDKVLFADLSRTDQAKVLSNIKHNEIDAAVQIEMAKADSPVGKREATNYLRTEYNKALKESRYDEMNNAFQIVEASVKAATPISDVASATKIMKLLDPNSVVRESELRVAMEASGLVDRWSNFYNRKFKGKFLTDQQRDEFYALAKDFMDISEKHKQSIDNRYSYLAEKEELDSSMIFGGAGSIPTYNEKTGDFD